MILIHTVFNSLQDVAVDALAVDLLADDERGRANGLMYGCEVRAAARSAASGWRRSSRAYGLDTALIAQTAILVAIMLVPFFVRERAATATPRTPRRDMLAALGQAFSLRSTLVAALLMLGVNFAIGCCRRDGYALFIGELNWSRDGLHARSPAAGASRSAAACGRHRPSCRSVRAPTSPRSRRAGRRAAGSCSRSSATHWGRRDARLGRRSSRRVRRDALGRADLAVHGPVVAEVAGSQFTAYMALSNFSTMLGHQFGRLGDDWWSSGVYLAAAVVQLAVTPLLLVHRSEPSCAASCRCRKAAAPTGSASGRCSELVFFDRDDAPREPEVPLARRRRRADAAELLRSFSARSGRNVQVVESDLARRRGFRPETPPNRPTYATRTQGGVGSAAPISHTCPSLEASQYMVPSCSRNCQKRCAAASYGVDDSVSTPSSLLVKISWSFVTTNSTYDSSSNCAKKDP